MIVCTECGHQNEVSDEFCGSCGNFLEWSGDSDGETESVAPPVTSSLVAEEASDAADLEAERVGTAAAEERARAEAEALAAEERARAESEAEALVADRARAEAEARAEQERATQAEVATRKEAEKAARAKTEARSAARMVAQARAEEEARAKQVAQAQVDRSIAAETRAAAQAEVDARAEAERRARVDAEASVVAEATARATQESERLAREEAEASARDQAAARRRADAEAARAEADAARAAEAARRAAAMVAKPPVPRPAPSGPRVPGARRPTTGGSTRGTPGATPPPAPPGAPGQPPARPPSKQPAAGPAARKPGKGGPELAPKRPPPPPRAIQPGDLICGQCGSDNAADRKFCRRCGASLVEAVVVPEPPWWRRVLSRRRAPAKAGERPGRQGRAGGQGAAATARTARNRGFKVLGMGKRVIVLLGLLGITIAAIGPWRGSITGAFDTLRGKISPQYEPARPTSAEATSSLPDHGPTLAVDGISNSYWAEGVEGDGQGQTLVLRFDRPVDLDRIGITSGTSGKPEDFVAQPRPEELHLVFSDGSTADISLKDSSTFQSFDIKARRATSVEVQIKSVYGALGGRDLAITEIELFTKT